LQRVFVGGFGALALDDFAAAFADGIAWPAATAGGDCDCRAVWVVVLVDGGVAVVAVAVG
jgi:hypothetical protein